MRSHKALFVPLFADDEGGEKGSHFPSFVGGLCGLKADYTHTSKLVLQIFG